MAFLQYEQADASSVLNFQQMLYLLLNNNDEIYIFSFKQLLR